MSRVHLHISVVCLAAIVSSLVSLRFFGFLPQPVNAITLAYMLLATLSQMSLLAIIAGLCVVPLLVIKSLRIRGLVYAAIFSLGICFLLIDTVVFSQYRFHINSVVFKLVTSGDVVSFSLVTWLVAAGVFVGLFLLSFKLIVWVDYRALTVKKRLIRLFAITVVASTLITHGVHVWASAYGVTPITITSRYLPLFKPATANRFMQKWGFVDTELQNRKKMVGLKQASDVNYPRQPLQEVVVSNPVNIMLLVVDSWRADSFAASETPEISNLAESGVVFDNHYSTGNSTRAGIFGLFYGIPAPYWHAFLASRQAPVLMSRLQNLGYEQGVFASAKLTQPEFDKTIFSEFDSLRIRSKGRTPAVRDRNLTDDWIDWYKNRRDPKLPSFSFLFYDAPHGYDFPKDYPHRFEPMLDEVNYLELNSEFDPEPLFNRYRTAVHYTDSLIGEVLSVLKQQNDLDNTLIIITGDHGQEFNDNGQGFWGHNSNFTDAQVKVPFILSGPGVSAAKSWSESGEISTHEDVAPTILANYLGLQNPSHDYSTGANLYGPVLQRSWRMAAKYSGYAIIQSETILEVTPSGQYSTYDMNNRLIDETEFNLEVIKEALENLQRFSH